jgi:diguanylate cyclase (GGDEF)-like protein
MQKPTVQVLELATSDGKSLKPKATKLFAERSCLSALTYGLVGLLVSYTAEVAFNLHEKVFAWNQSWEQVEYAVLPGAILVGLLFALARLVVLQAQSLAIRAKELEISALARRDILTGISSRFHAEEVLFKLDPAELRLCLLIDVRKFSEVNSCFGYSEGDNVLKEIAQRLQVLLNHAAVVARIDSDSFVVITQRLENEEKGKQLAQYILSILEKPYLGGMELVLRFSVGAVFLGNADLSPREIMKRMDIGLHESLAQAEGGIVYYEDRMAEVIRRRRLIELRLRKAVVQDEVRPFLQPIVDISTEELRGFEILARWTDSEIGVVSPDEFVATAEQSGLLGRLGEQLLRHACHYTAAWPQHILMSYNLSAGQLLLPDMATRLLAILAETGFSAGRLQIEITESSELVRSEIATQNLARLRGAGIGIAMDDFGTGYCSFERLSGSQLTCLKIDKSFVMAMHEKAEMCTIVLAAIQLAKQLGLKVVAEGVETREQQATLVHMGCDLGQGYLFSKPVPMQEANVMVLGAMAKKMGVNPSREFLEGMLEERMPRFA